LESETANYKEVGIYFKQKRLRNIKEIDFVWNDNILETIFVDAGFEIFNIFRKRVHIHEDAPEFLRDFVFKIKSHFFIVKK